MWIIQFPEFWKIPSLSFSWFFVPRYARYVQGRRIGETGSDTGKALDPGGWSRNFSEPSVVLFGYPRIKGSNRDFCRDDYFNPIFLEFG